MASTPPSEARGHVRALMAEVHRHFDAEALPFLLLFAFVPAVASSAAALARFAARPSRPRV